MGDLRERKREERKMGEIKKEIKCISHHFSLYPAWVLQWLHVISVPLAWPSFCDTGPCRVSLHWFKLNPEFYVFFLIFSLRTPYSRMVASSITNFWAAITIYCYHPQPFQHTVELISWIKFPWLEISDFICIS